VPPLQRKRNKLYLSSKLIRTEYWAFCVSEGRYAGAGGALRFAHLPNLQICGKRGADENANQLSNTSAVMAAFRPAVIL
jgi:hypothetical protein